MTADAHEQPHSRPRVPVRHKAPFVAPVIGAGSRAAPRAASTRAHEGARATLEPDRWVDRHADALYRYAHSRLGEPSAAEDAVQEGLLAALASIDRFEGSSSERTWLIGIVRHKVLDQIRRCRRAAGADAGDDARAVDSKDDARGDRFVSAPDPGEHASRHEARTQLRRALDRLPPALRQLLLLREVDAVPTATLCEIYGVTPTNLWTMLHRAKARLRALLETDSRDDPSWSSS